ncbi:MAG: hypothetical protein ACPGZP_05600 [Panacagrimonas sp.]
MCIATNSTAVYGCLADQEMSPVTCGSQSVLENAPTPTAAIFVECRQSTAQPQFLGLF